MKKAQSLIEFAIILIAVTIVAVISLQLISNKINSSSSNDDNMSKQETNIQTSEEEYCKKLGLSWDKENGICEAK